MSYVDLAITKIKLILTDLLNFDYIISCLLCDNWIVHRTKVFLNQDGSLPLSQKSSTGLYPELLTLR